MLIFTEIFNKFFYQKTITFQKNKKKMQKEDLKKGNYYEVFFNNSYDKNELNVIKYLGDNKIEYIDNKIEYIDNNQIMELSTNRDYLRFREISITPKHLENLGFNLIDKEYNSYERKDLVDIKIIMDLLLVSKNSEHIKAILLNSFEYILFIKKQPKLTQNKILVIENSELEIGIRIENVNELFKKLEEKGVKINNKEEVVMIKG